MTEKNGGKGNNGGKGQTGQPMPKSIRGNVPIHPDDQKKPSVLHDPPAAAEERIKNRQTHRITPVAKVFIIQCITSGYTNSQINQLLREKQFILSQESDLSHDALSTIRKLDDCKLDLELLTLEARQVGHARLSALILDWAALSKMVFARLNGEGAFGDDFEHLSVAECTQIITKATGLLLDVFGAGIGEQIKAEYEGQKDAEVNDPSEVYDPLYPSAFLGDDLPDYIAAVSQASLKCAVRELTEEGKLSEEAAAEWTAILNERPNAP